MDYIDEIVIRTSGVGLKGNFEYEKVISEKELLLASSNNQSNGESSSFTLQSIDDYEGEDDDDCEDAIKTSFIRRISTCQARRTLGYYFAVCSSRLNLSSTMDLTPTYFEVTQSASPSISANIYHSKFSNEFTLAAHCGPLEGKFITIKLPSEKSFLNWFTAVRSGLAELKLLTVLGQIPSHPSTSPSIPFRLETADLIDTLQVHKPYLQILLPLPN